MDRRLITAIAAFLVFFVGYGAMARAIDKAPRDESWFWVNKMSWKSQFDLVLAGDSRVNRGVDPVKLSLSGVAPANFAFSGQGWSQEYLDRIPTLLKEDGKKIIALGITPRSFTDLAVKSGDYSTWSHKRPINLWSLQTFSSINSFMIPENPVMLFGRAASKSAPVYKQWHTAEGWMPMTKSILDITSAEEEYKTLFAANKVKKEHVDRLAAAIKDWSSKGIKVYLFRPPISDEIRKIEDQDSEFDESAVKDQLTSAGATWLPDASGTPFGTADGHHLSREEAERYSAALGQVMNQAIQ